MYRVAHSINLRFRGEYAPVEDAERGSELSTNVYMNRDQIECCWTARSIERISATATAPERRHSAFDLILQSGSTDVSSSGGTITAMSPRIDRFTPLIYSEFEESIYEAARSRMTGAHGWDVSDEDAASYIEERCGRDPSPCVGQSRRVRYPYRISEC